MAVGRWRVDVRILLACLGVLAFLLVVNVLAGTCANVDRGKMKANQIMSPWDRSAVPPVMGPSLVSTKPMPAVTPVPEPDSEHKSTAGHHHRRHWAQRTVCVDQ